MGGSYGRGRSFEVGPWSLKRSESIIGVPKKPESYMENERLAYENKGKITEGENNCTYLLAFPRCGVA